MRTLLLAALGLSSVSAAAQTFRLVEPVLSVDGRRVGVVGAPLLQSPFGVLVLSVPGSGTYRVSSRPFAGSRGVGQFDGAGLAFAVDGQSVRLRSAEPILDAGGPATAFVRFDPSVAPSARGLARVAVSDAADARGRSSADVAARTERPRRGPDPPARPADDAARRDADRLRAELDRVSAERRALALERDRLRAERDAALAGRPGSRARWTGSDRDDALTEARARTATLTDERDRAVRDRGRLLAERDQIAAARDRAESDRARLATDLDAARRRAEAAEAAGRLADADRAQGETGRLRAEIAARDRALDALRTESDDRAARLAETDAALGVAQRALVAAEADRASALSARDAALTERDRAFRERDALLAGRTATDDRAALDAARARLDADRAAAAAGSPTAEERALLADRQRLLDQIEAAQAERDALALQVSVLQEERDGLRTRVDRLTADLAAERAASDGQTGRPADARPADPAPDASRDAADEPRRDGAAVSFPGFDFARLRNPDVVRRRLDEAEYPPYAAASRIEGDVLVLFQTDRDGRVIRTAVASPIGGGLDGLAESLVQEMRFVPPVVDGLPTGLRSQVLVRFER